MNNILALDQASRVSGFAVFSDKKLIKYGKIIPKAEELGKRFLDIRQQVLNLIQEYDINEVIFEDIQLQNNINNVKTFKVLAQLQGVLIVLLENLNIPYTIIPSTTWKSGLKIKGKARAEQKRNAQNYVTETYNIKATQDESDAICIGTYHLNNIPFDWS